MADPGQMNATFMYTDTWGIYLGTVDNLTDGDSSTALDFRTLGDTTRKGDYIGWDLGKETAIGKIHAVIGGDRSAGDKWKKYSLQYSNDNQNWTTYKTYQGLASGKDTVEENFYGLKARYVRLVNEEERAVWVIFSEFSVKAYNPDEDFNNANVYTNTDYRLASQSEEALTELIYNQEITLEKGQYVGVDLSRIKDLSTFNIDYENGQGATLQVSKNGVEWTTVTGQEKELPDGRYVRLINKTDKAIKLTINHFEVHSNEITAPYLYKTTMNINPSWGVNEDTRNNGAAFDGNIDSTTEFGDFPQKGQYIIYDLGQERTISKIQMYCQDSAVNYIRDADILVSDDLENWTKVITIGDGVENTNDAEVKCIDSDAGYKASSTYPNKVYVEGTANNVKARYLKILMTETNNNRAVVFNEIVINDGEYVPVSNDPTYTSSTVEANGFIPQYMFDGDLSTAYRPGSKEAGSITYTLSSDLDVKKMHIIQKGEISNARVSVLVDGENGKKWVQVGTLKKSLNEFYMPEGNVYELKIEWDENQIPTISEVIMLNDDEYASTAANDLQSYIDFLDVKQNKYTADSYKEFEKALKQAQKVLDKQAGELDAITNAKAELEVAYANLVKRGDIQGVKDELDTINKLKEKDYTSETWAILQDQVKLAQEFIKKDETTITEKEVIDMVDALQKAKAQLVTKVSVSKKELKDYIASNELDKLDTNKYLTSTADSFKEALKNAQTLIEQEDATKEQLDEALKQLQDARTQLVLKATDDEVNALKALMDQYQEKDYTASSWKEFEKVYNDVKAALENENTSDDVQALTNTLKEAAQKLVKRGNLDGIHGLLDQIKQLDSKKYTEASYSKLIDVVTEISKKLENSSEMTQEEVDALVSELQNAINALEKAPTITTDTNEPAHKPQVVTNNKVKTGDSTSAWTFATFALMAAIVYVSLRKRTKED
jgi:hyaluronoglucosaminidase